MVVLGVGEVVLRVVDAREKDYGSFKARFDIDVMKKLGIGPGDVVEIVGRRRTVAIAWPSYPEDEGKGIVRLDSVVRRNAGVEIGDKVVVRKASFSEAKTVVLTPLSEITVTDAVVSYVKRRLIDIPLVSGDKIPAPFVNKQVFFKVEFTFPQGAVVITPNTEVLITRRSREAPLNFKLAVAKLLEEEGYRIIHVGKKESEIDIIAEKDGRKTFVKIVEEQFKSKEENLYITLGKLLTQMKNPKAEYMIVLTEEYENLTNKIPEYVKNKLNLKTLIIERKYTIKKKT
ncbi:MAG: hypothetical protein B6U76_06105 [Desulfurococcales archaeon ex4484_217_2]|nr:MAG: hypothetical protein B6U76_06105 [Desulfurococcales archaeon ex4484_217_2]